MNDEPSDKRNHTIRLEFAHPLPQNGPNSSEVQEPRKGASLAGQAGRTDGISCDFKVRPVTSGCGLEFGKLGLGSFDTAGIVSATER